VIVVGAVAWQIAVLRGGGSPAVSGAVSTAGTAALCLALGLELLHRSRSWRAALGLSILMLAGAIAALAVPDRLARGLVDLAVLAGRDVWSVRLIGVGLVQEVLLALAAWRGWLRPRPSWITELAVCGAVSVVLLAGLVLLGEVQVTSAVLVVVLARGVVTPLLRRS
jgi:stage V sporulation protein SpoVS